MSFTWSGIFPAVTTKFNADFSIDENLTARHIIAQVEAGVHGIVVAGSLGEASTLSQQDKLQLILTAKRAVSGRVPVISGLAEGSTEAAIQFAMTAEDAGVDGFMLLPPLQYKSDERETIQYLRKVARATKLPIMIYNNPVSYGVDVTADMLVELADEPTLVAIKESSDDVRRITEIINRTGDRYQIFTGVDNLGMESLVMGACGWVAGLVCAFPEETVAIYNLVRQGRTDEAREIYRWFMPLLNLDVSNKLVQNIKLAEVMVGLGSETVRPPRLPLSGSERSTVEAVISEALKNRPNVQAFLHSATV